MSLSAYDGYQTYVDASAALTKWTVFDAALSTGRRADSGSAHLSGVGELRKVITAASDLITGTAYKQTALFASTLIAYRTAAGEQISLRTTAEGQLYVSRNGSTLWTSGVNPVYKLTAGVWQYLEFKATIDGTAGAWSLRVNGLNLTTVTQTGVNTAGQGGATADQVAFVQSLGSNDSYFADTYICDGTGLAPYNDFLGDCRVDRLLPNANGTYNDLSLSAGSDTYPLVDEPTPDGASSYIFGTAVDAKSTVNVDSLPYTPTQVYAMSVVQYSRKDDSGARGVKATIRSGAVDADSAAHALTTDYARYEDVFITDPSTSTQFTPGGINAVEIGVKLTA